ncbi:hypothetical protein B0H65DRAFT_241636 [Neurospora tetraspora]|uniref:Secreted protein n=1 Tax=Neurospora tetraspora TaxID=94610 RepID=A0AAE0JDH4_9PEZI|nr:hypothetical protein B0H65DRAFT_241636 [Neurospora tetraspora]
MPGGKWWTWIRCHALSARLHATNCSSSPTRWSRKGGSGPGATTRLNLFAEVTRRQDASFFVQFQSLAAFQKHPNMYERSRRYAIFHHCSMPISTLFTNGHMGAKRMDMTRRTGSTVNTVCAQQKLVAGNTKRQLQSARPGATGPGPMWNPPKGVRPRANFLISIHVQYTRLLHFQQ